MPECDHLEHCHSSKAGRSQKLPGHWVLDGWVEHRPITDGGSPPLRTQRWVWVESSPTVGKCRANVGVKMIATCAGCKDTLAP